jgi:hypothetical protein
VGYRKITIKGVQEMDLRKRKIRVFHYGEEEEMEKTETTEMEKGRWTKNMGTGKEA